VSPLYWLMAIDQGNVNSMFNLGQYYSKIKNYQLMIVYYLMAINRGCIYSIKKLINYYLGTDQLEEMVY